MSLGDNIRFLRIKRGYSQDYIAEQLGYKSYTTVQKWESGVSEPPIKKLKELSVLLNADMNDMANTDMTNSMLPTNKNNSGCIINVLGRVTADIPIESIQEIIDTIIISEDFAHTGSFFGLQIKDDSMEPRIYEKDVVIVRQQNDAENGDTVIALINGDDAVCRRLRKYHDGIELISINPTYKPMYYSNEEIEKKPIRIIGKVVELRGKF